VGSSKSESFREVVVATAPSLFRLAARLMGNAQEAEDVLQESYARAWDAYARDRFEGRAQLDTWLYRIVTNCALDALRSRGRRRGAVELDVEIAAEGPRTDVGAALSELSTWLDALPEDQRAAIVLKEMEGMTSVEIAGVLGCSEGAVEQKLVRARATLRGRMARG